MGAFLSALIPIITALVSGSGFSADVSALVLPLLTSVAGPDIEAAIGAISLTQWISLGINLVEVVPELKTDVEKVYADLHPTIALFIADLNSHLKVGKPVQIAAELAAIARMPKTIPGYGADGSLTDIPNPDLKPGA